MFDGTRVEFFFNEHPPPHFHAICAGERGAITIGSLELLKGTLIAPNLRRVKDWAASRREALMHAWKNCRNHEEPGWIK
ncbi:MAG: DUF4160 domain-containing protein [Hyphomicrobiales bacterium]